MDARASLINSELQSISCIQWKELCKELRLRHTGRKDELRMRVVDCLTTEEGRRRVADTNCSQALTRVARLVGGTQLAASRLPPAPINLAPPIQYTKSCVCGGSALATGLTCKRCGAFQHISCMGRAATMSRFECPLCQIQQMEPYEPVVEVVLPPSIPCTNGCPMIPSSFRYTEDQQRMLVQSGRLRTLQLRCIRLDEEGYTHHWPKDCNIILNGKTVCSFAQPPSTSARKRKDTAVVISQLAIGPNEAMLVRQREDCMYAFGIFIVEKLSPESVVSALSSSAEQSLDAGLSFVRSRIGGSEEVLTDSYRQSLKCPLTRLIPEVPARGRNCKHIQCFDLQPYVIMQEKAKVNRWRCPICNALVLSVVIDLYMKEIVRKATESFCTSVEFSPDGTYTLVKEENEEGSDDSEEEQKIGVKRATQNSDAPLPVKKPASHTPDSSLRWGDFLRNSVTLDLLHHTVAYQNAYRKSISKIPTPKPRFPDVRSPPPRKDLGRSIDCPIEIDD